MTQAGSFVGPDGLRFDFTHGQALTREELDAVEREVNAEALKGTPVTTYVDLPIEEARARGAMALFGEKYGDRVRMVEVGDFSRELCGGIHVASTGEIGLFRIASESSAASGVRRIEALTGLGAYEHARAEAATLRSASELLKASGDLVGAVERLQGDLREERRRRERAELASLRGTSGASVTEVAGIALWRQDFGAVDPAAARRAVDDAAQGQGLQVTLGATVGEGKVQFVCKVGPEAIARGAHAGNLLREVAKVAGGGGGGKPDFATAGGKDPAKVGDALASAETALAAMLGG